MFHFTGLSNLETMSNECYGSVTVKRNSKHKLNLHIGLHMQTLEKLRLSKK